MQKAIDMVDAIGVRSWRGAGDELVSLLGHNDAVVRSHVAVRVAELVNTEEVGLAELGTLLDVLAAADVLHPGVADAFYGTFIYGKITVLDDDDRSRVRAWVLRVLLARAGKRALDTPVPGNNLEFHAHELFDGDSAALGELLAHGYDDIVMQSLDHEVLGRTDAIALLRTLYARDGDAHLARWLTLGYGETISELVARWPELALPGGIRARYESVDYATRRLWTVFHVVPEPSDARLPPDDDALFAALVNGLPLGVPEAVLDAAAIRHIGLPKLEATSLRELRPREDLQIVMLQHPSTCALQHVRVVRARRPLER